MVQQIKWRSLPTIRYFFAEIFQRVVFVCHIMSSAPILEEVNPVWDIFDIPEFDKSIAQLEEHEILEQGGGGYPMPLNKNSYVFNITDKRRFSFLHMDRLRILYKIVNSVNPATPYADDAKITLGSSVFNMFYRMTLWVGTAKVEEVNSAQIRGLLLELLREKEGDYGSQAQSWFYPETDGVADRGRADVGNPSFVKRQNRQKSGSPETTNPGNEVELWLPLTKCFGFLRDNKKALISQSIRIEIIPATRGTGLIKSNSVVVGPPDVDVVPNGTIHITNMTLWSWSAIPSNSILPDLLRDLNSNKQVVRMWTQHDVLDLGTVQDTAVGSASVSMENKYATLGKVYIIAQPVPVDNGDQRYNPGMFAPINWKNVNIMMNGSSFPHTAYELDFTKKQFGRAYQAFLEATKMRGEYESYVDFDSFKDAYRVLVFDLNHPGQAVYEQTTQTSLIFKYSYDASPVKDAYGTVPTEAADKRYHLYAVVESYKTVQINLTDGTMVFSNISA